MAEMSRTFLGSGDANLAVSVKQQYTLPTTSAVTVSSLVFPGSDRLPDEWVSETSRNFVRHPPAAIKAAQESGAGAAKPRDVPDYTTAAEYSKRNFVKLGVEPYDPGNTESKAAFPRFPSSSYTNPRAAKVIPPSGTGLYFGSEAPSFETDSRANFLPPLGAARAPNAAERKAVNLAINVAKFTLGVEPAPGGGFETTSRAAAAQMLAASCKPVRPPSGASKYGGETAAEMAKVTHINFVKDRDPADLNFFSGQEKGSSKQPAKVGKLAKGMPDMTTTMSLALPRHPVKAYAEREGPCNPIMAAMGEMSATATCKMVVEATGEVVEVPRVQSGLDMLVPQPPLGSPLFCCFARAPSHATPTATHAP